MRYFFLCFISCLTFAQQSEVVDFLRIEAQLEIQPEKKAVEGLMTATFRVLVPTDSVYLDANDMTLTEVNTTDFGIIGDASKIWFMGAFKPNQEYKANFHFKANPKQTIYFTGDQVWTQGQGKYTSHWLPSLDDMNDKIEFDLWYSVPSGDAVVANGLLTEVEKLEKRTVWKYDMDKPMSSYLVAMAAGDFTMNKLQSASGVSIELYLDRKDSLKMEPTYRYTKEIFDYLENEIGVPYPWQNYKQVPVRDFLYAGMENTTATIFSEAFVVDEIGFQDRNYVNVNAHELAHQWFGNLVTETTGKHHWLHEGFASYYALLAERAVFGEEYYYWKLYQSAEQLKELSDQGKGESLLNPKASSLTFYEKGAWALHILRDTVGDDNFREAVANYLKNHAYGNVTTDDFLTEVKKLAGKKADAWEQDWLRQSAFKAEQAFNSLMKSEFMNEYFALSSLRPADLSIKKNTLLRVLTFPNDYLGQEAVLQLSAEPIDESLNLYYRAFESNNLFMRQAIALSMQEIPQQLIPLYEGLLNDDSYVTREAALYNLWANVPEKRAVYLDQMESDYGFQDKGLRQLWLALTLVTQNYRQEEKPGYLKELESYTSPEYSFEVRQKAFEYIEQLNLYSDDVLKHLINACVHHNWRFRNAARAFFDTALKDKRVNQRVTLLEASLPEREKAYISRIFSE